MFCSFSVLLLVLVVLISSETVLSYELNETACSVCTCWARSTCDGDKENPFYDEIRSPDCKSGIIDCRDKSLTELPPIHNGTVTVKEQNQAYGHYYDATYKIGKVWLSGNAFSTIPSDYFVNVSESVTEIYANNNPDLASFGDGLFSNMPNLRYMIAHYSGLESLGANLFSGSTSLEKLWLHNNQISTIDKDAFKGIGPSLSELYLTENKVSSLDPSTFSGLSGVSELWMMENLNITKSDISCSHLCDIPENADIKMFDEQVTMLCGTGCTADAGDEAINEDGANACGYNSCVTWDLNSGWRAGWGVWKVTVVCGVLSFLLSYSIEFV